MYGNLSHPRRESIFRIDRETSYGIHYGDSLVIGEYWWHSCWPVFVRVGDYCPIGA